MTAFTFFTSTEELEILTGLLKENLPENGFTFNDFSYGFVSDENYMALEDSAADMFDRIDVSAPVYAYDILFTMDGSGSGVRHVEYRGKHYYIKCNS